MSRLSLSKIVIFSGATEIGYYIFQNRRSLTEITVPDSVTSIEDNAFLRCRSLSDMFCSGTQESRNAIEIGADNETLQNASIHFSVSPA